MHTGPPVTVRHQGHSGGGGGALCVVSHVCSIARGEWWSSKPPPPRVLYVAWVLLVVRPQPPGPQGRAVFCCPILAVP